MAVGVFDRVWKHSKHGGTELLVLLAIADNANEEHAEAWPSIAYLAQKTRMTERGVQKVIRRLQQSGELEVLPPKGDRKANTYRVNVAERTGEQRSGVNDVQGEPPFGGEGEQDSPGGVNGGSPKPSIEPSIEPSTTPYSPPGDGMTQTGSIYSDDFETFWKAYPRKVKKGYAWQSWQKIKARPTLEAVLLAIDGYRESLDWLKNDGEFIPHPSTWINGRCWEDAPTTKKHIDHLKEDTYLVSIGREPIWPASMGGLKDD